MIAMKASAPSKAISMATPERKSNAEPWKTLFSAVPEKNPFSEESSRGLPSLFATASEQRKQHVISGVHEKGDYKKIDESKQTLLVDLSPEKPQRRNKISHSSTSEEPRKTQKSHGLPKEIWFFLFVFLVAFVLCIQSYLKVSPLEDFSTYSSDDSEQLEISNASEEVSSVSTLGVFERINRVIQGEKTSLVPPRLKDGLESSGISKLVTQVTNAVSLTATKAGKVFAEGRRKTLNLLSEIDGDNTRLNNVNCNQSWHGMLHRHCRVGNKKGTAGGLRATGSTRAATTMRLSGKQVLESMLTRTGRDHLRQSLSTVNHSNDDGIDESSSSSPPAQKQRRPRATFRETMILGFQAHSSNFQQTRIKMQKLRDTTNYR